MNNYSTVVLNPRKNSWNTLPSFAKNSKNLLKRLFVTSQFAKGSFCESVISGCIYDASADIFMTYPIKISAEKPIKTYKRPPKNLLSPLRIDLDTDLWTIRVIRPNTRQQIARIIIALNPEITADGMFLSCTNWVA